MGIAVVTNSAVAAPLPVGTQLTIASSTDLPAGGDMVTCTTNAPTSRLATTSSTSRSRAV
jgi:hypothetical protein